MRIGEEMRKIEKAGLGTYLIYVGGTLVSWASRKQNTVARSSTEVEYRAIATTTQKVEAVKTALYELGVQIPVAMMILTDN